jgi:hypothetical protein
MRTKFNNSELSHIWANQTQSHGKGSNMFFEHGTIYSYGYHFKLAQFVNNKEGQRCVLINSKSYSNTTSKHQSLVWRAIPQNVPFFKVVSFFNDIDASSTAHKENLTHYINEAERLQGLTIRANKLKMFYLTQLKNEINLFDKYCTFFTLDNLERFNPISGQGLTIKERYELINSFIWGFENSEELKKWKIKQEENKKKAEAKALIDAKEKIELFRQFKISSIYANLGHYLLRYNKETDNIETSGGVKMSKDLFLSAYQRLINNELLKGQHVDKYTFNGVDGDIVSVGCHKIPMTEINSIVAVL